MDHAPAQRYQADIANGLSQEQVQERIDGGWTNKMVTAESKTVGQIVKGNLLTYFNLIFAILAILVIAAGSFRSLTFLPVVIANLFIGILEEIRAKKTLAQLTMLNAPNAEVVRNGQISEIPAEELVLDDIVIFRAGDQICADAIVLDGSVLVNEALLTGESDELRKELGDFLMSGSFVVSGECYARLERVGADSYISELTLEAKAQDQKKHSEMLRVLDRLVGIVGILIIPIGVFLFVQQYVFSGASFQSSILSMVAAVVGIISETDISTACTMLLAIEGFMILYHISKPLNLLRWIVWIGSGVGLLVCSIYLGDIFGITHMSMECVMLFVVFAIVTEPVLRYSTMFIERMGAMVASRRRKRAARSFFAQRSVIFPYKKSPEHHLLIG